LDDAEDLSTLIIRDVGANSLGALWSCAAIALNSPGNVSFVDGTTHFKNVNNYFNANIYSYLETSVGQSSHPY
jgi:hypothetical protein